MSVLINGMKMPTVGRILIIFPSGRTLEVSADNTQNILGEAQAIPVPPHGNLADVDALCDCFYKDYFRFDAEAIVNYIRANAPIIIPTDKEDEI